MNEESIEFVVPKPVFYNPQMRFCRSFASLAVGAIGQNGMIVCDAFSASGIRGIRYAKENRNVKKTIFIDVDRKAVSAEKRNAKTNNVKSEVMHGNISRLVFGICADFLEIDPFGSPAPYLYDSFRVFNPLKQAYLSVTATDVAVLCGGKTKACLKNYHSVPLNNEFTHETGMRILIKKIAETAAEFNMGIEPIVSLSRQHYLKTIVKVTRSADLADSSLKKLGHVSFCMTCGWRGTSQFPIEECPEGSRIRNLKHETRFAGPLWLGELHDKDILKNMISLNRKRAYSDQDALHKTLVRMQGEAGMPPFYYDVHQMCRRLGCKAVPKMEEVLSGIERKGYNSFRTHFSETAIKTDAPMKIIKSVIL